jgi:hypothetical protein
MLKAHALPTKAIAALTLASKLAFLVHVFSTRPLLIKPTASHIQSSRE